MSNNKESLFSLFNDHYFQIEIDMNILNFLKLSKKIEALKYYHYAKIKIDNGNDIYLSICSSFSIITLIKL